MTNRNIVNMTIAVAAAFVAVGYCSPAAAQEGEGGNTGTVIIKGPEGTRVIHINPGDLQAGDGSIAFISVSDGGIVTSFAGSPADLPFNGLLGPLGLMSMGAGGGANPALNIIDPAVSYIHQLIKRPDVRSDLFLDSKQREQLEKMMAEESQSVQHGIAQFRTGQKAGEEAAQTPEEDRARKLHELVPGSPTERDRKLAAILTPKQIARLKELDLQYRGPLALGIKPVAQKVKLVDPEAPAVTDLLSQYHDAVRKALGFEQKTSKTEGPNGSTSVSVNSNFSGSLEEMKARLEKAHDEIEQSRRKLGDKALKSITDTERSQWKSLTGTRFQFQSLN